MNLSQPSPFSHRSVSRTSFNLLPHTASGGRKDQSRGGRRPTLELARACAKEASVGAQMDSQGLLFLTGCALSIATGCAFQMEKFAAHWDTFEGFVRALIA